MSGYPAKRYKNKPNDKELDFEGIHFRRTHISNLYVPEAYTYGRYRQKLEKYRKRERPRESSFGVIGYL